MIKANDLAIVYSTCEKYSFVWDAWYYYFKKFWDLDYPQYIISDAGHPSFPGFTPIESSLGTNLLFWSQRIIEGVKQIPHNHIFFLLDDLFFQKDITKEFPLLYKAFVDLNADSLRVVNAYNPRKFKFKDTDISINDKFITIVDQNYGYLVSYMPIILKKDFLIECLLGRKGPWDAEKKGSSKIRFKGKRLFQYYVHGWVDSGVVVKGILTKHGRSLINKADND